MSKAQLLRVIDESLAKMGRQKWRWHSGPLPLCKMYDLDCENCPAAIAATGSRCAGWENSDQEIVYFCFVRAMVECGG